MRRHAPWIALAVYAAAVVAIGVFDYRDRSQELRAHFDRNLLIAAHGLNGVVPLAAHRAATAADASWPAERDAEVVRLLSRIAADQGVRFLYTVVVRDGAVRFSASSATPEELVQGDWARCGDPYDDHPPEVLVAAAGAAPVFADYTDRWGTFRSVFLAQRAADGTAWVAGVDHERATLDAAQAALARRAALVNALLLAIGLAVAVVARWLMARRAAAERALAANEERWQLALAGSDVGVWDWDVASGTVYMSARWKTLLGHAPDAPLEPAFATWSGHVAEADRQRAIRAVQEHAAGSTPRYECEYRMRRTDGSEIWVLDRGQVVARDPGGAPRRMIGTILDITARRRTEADLAAREALLDATARSAGLLLGGHWQELLGTCLAQLGQAAGCSRAYAFRNRGAAGGGLLTSQIAEWCAPGIIPQIANPELQDLDLAAAGLGRWIAVLDGAQAVSGPVSGLPPAERALLERQQIRSLIVLPIAVRGAWWGFIGFDDCRAERRWSAAEQAALGAAAGLLGAAIERAMSEDELREARDAAQAAATAKAAFLANMSHEIRTPMNGVLGMTELLLGMGLTPEQEEAARTAYRSAEGLLALLNDILDFSKIDAGRMELESVPFELPQLVYDVAALFRGRIDHAAVELIVRVDDRLGRRVGDPGRVRQVLTNLLGNAVKFTPRGHILVEAVRAGDGVRLAVVDTGVGIPADRIGHLFQPFTQADASTARRYGGTGLGLAICHRLCGLMGGSIAVRSEHGAGSEFAAVLPLPAQPGAAPFAAPPQALAGQRILVLDDVRTQAELCAEQLVVRGAETSVALSGVEALRLLAAAAEAGRPVAAVVVDQLMPGMDGLAFAAALHADARLAATPLVLVTGTAMRGDGRSVTEAGFAGFLVKPVPPDTLAAALATAIARRAAGDRSLVTRHQLAGSAPSASGDAIPAQPARGLRVLLAEDNPINQRIAKAMLERLGAQVEVAPDGSVAVAAHAAGGHDLVFMDCQMPGMDGYEATRQIRAAEASSGARRIPIIALTANAAPADRERCLASGMDDHIAKPVRLADLTRAIAAWLPAASSGPAASPPHA